MSQSINDLDTPCVLVDLDRVETNIRAFQQHCDELGLKHRPHIKTHKLAEFARLQIKAGAVGITCQKLGEAEVMADAGITDIFLPYNLLGAAKLARAVALAQRIKLSLSCDNVAVAQGLSGAFSAAGLTVNVLVECETGLKRCGVQTPDEAVELAKAIAALPGLAFGGLMTYPPPGGALYADQFLGEAVNGLRAAGLPCPVVSTGGSPDMWQAGLYRNANEYRTGTYIYNDRSLIEYGACDVEDCALTVLTTVISTPEPQRCVIDAGSKAVTSDTMGLMGHALFLEHRDLMLVSLSEEHGGCVVPQGQTTPQLGERLRLIPNHVCVVSNLFDEVHLVRGDQVQARVPVAARGRVA
jgi:D-serine deaminase-like pyridoxal phosphate-dependent protein